MLLTNAHNHRFLLLLPALDAVLLKLPFAGVAAAPKAPGVPTKGEPNPAPMKGELPVPPPNVDAVAPAPKPVHT